MPSPTCGKASWAADVADGDSPNRNHTGPVRAEHDETRPVWCAKVAIKFKDMPITSCDNQKCLPGIFLHGLQHESF